MKCITLKEFKEMFFPNTKGIEFSKKIGFTNSFINKIMNGRYDCRRGKEFERLNKYVKQYGYELINDNYIAKEADKCEKIFNKMQHEIDIRDAKIRDLENLVEDLLKSVRIMSTAKEAYKDGTFRFDKYKQGIREVK